jgi:hypothetical protein
VCVCVHKWSLSFRYSHQEHIFCHSNTFHMHCPSHSSGCRSVPSSVSVSLETVASILVVLVAGNLLALLLYVIERCVRADRQTYSSPGHLDTSDSHFVNKETYIIKEYQRSPTFIFTIYPCFLRNTQHIAV